MSFMLLTIIFSLPCQVILIIGPHVLPIDYSTVIIYLIFVILELIFGIRAIRKVIKRQAAVYYLRNSTAKIISHEVKIKSSKEIEDELFTKFPNM